jgi:Ribonuclease G/E
MPNTGSGPLVGRLPEFKQMAAEARRDAARATTPEMKRGYEQLAQSWDQLIQEIEANPEQ